MGDDDTGISLSGAAIRPVIGDEVQIVEGRLGNPIMLNDDVVFRAAPHQSHGGTFYILVAGQAGHSAQQVAEHLRDQHRLSIRPFVPAGPDPSQSSFQLQVDPGRSYHYLDQEIRGQLRFNPNISYLSAIYGERADYFMVACRLPNRREAIFGRNFRTVTDERGQPTGENINVRRFDLIQRSIDGTVEVLHRGGLALFDRQDLAGNPDYLYGVNMSDLHLARRNDQFELTIMLRIRDQNMYFRYNNANANFVEAIIPWINAEYRAGRLDWVQVLGDNIDFDGVSYETSRRLTDSNNYYLARFLDQIEPPTFVVLGNHDRLQKFPASLTPINFGLTTDEVRRLEADRYGHDLTDIGYYLGDAIASIMDDPDSLIPYYDVINPFHDFVVDLGRGDASDTAARSARLLFMDMGGADLAHFRQDDPIYRDLQMWPWQPPYLHFQTIIEAALQGTPDLRGPTDEQLSWLSAQVFTGTSHTVLLTHPPLLNSTDSQVAYDRSTHPAIQALVPVGTYDDVHYATITHGDQMMRIVADSPDIRLHIGGHTHFDGNGYVMGLDRHNVRQVFRGPVREVLNQLPVRDAHLTEHFWFPRSDCLESCSPAVHTLYQGIIERVRNHKVFWQAGAAGAGPDPVFSRLTLTPEGLISHEDHFYINKVLRRRSGHPHEYVVRREVQSRPRPNRRLIAQWARIRRQDPLARLSQADARRVLEARMATTDTSFVPNAGSLRDYPRYNDPIEHPYISPTRIHPQLRLRAVGDYLPDFSGAGRGYTGNTIGLSVEYLFSEDQIGTIPRILFLQGIELGWFRTEPGSHYAYVAARTPTVID